MKNLKNNNGYLKCNRKLDFIISTSYYFNKKMWVVVTCRKIIVLKKKKKKKKEKPSDNMCNTKSTKIV